MKYQFIREQHHQIDVKRLCAVLQVSRSAYYSWQRSAISPRETQNQELVKRMTEIHQRSHRTYGSPRLCDALRQLQSQACCTFNAFTWHSSKDGTSIQGHDAFAFHSGDRSRLSAATIYRSSTKPCLDIGYNLYLDTRRMGLSGGSLGPVFPDDRWLGSKLTTHGKDSHHGCSTSALLAAAFRGFDSSFRSRISVCQY